MLCETVIRTTVKKDSVEEVTPHFELIVDKYSYTNYHAGVMNYYITNCNVAR